MYKTHYRALYVLRIIVQLIPHFTEVSGLPVKKKSANNFRVSKVNPLQFSKSPSRCCGWDSNLCSLIRFSCNRKCIRQLRKNTLVE